MNFDVHDIYMQYKGKPLKKERGVVEVYDMHSQRIKKLIGIDIQMVTYQKYLESGKHLKDFIKHKLHKTIMEKWFKRRLLRIWEGWGDFVRAQEEKRNERKPYKCLDLFVYLFEIYLPTH